MGKQMNTILTYMQQNSEAYVAMLKHTFDSDNGLMIKNWKYDMSNEELLQAAALSRNSC